MINIRRALATDQPTINRIIHEAGINPMSLDWHHFVIAEDSQVQPEHNRRIVGIGQVKQHGDGSRELASIAVISECQEQGIASEIIRHLLASESGDVYLTCRNQLESFYTRFGFRRIERDARSVPPYFRRIIRLTNIFLPLMRGTRIIVMMNEKLKMNE